jgi:hypothetical protein
MTGAFIAVKANIISQEKITGEAYYSSPVRAEIVDALKMMIDEHWIERVDDPPISDYPHYIVDATNWLWGGYSSANGFVKVRFPNVDNWWFRLTSGGEKRARELIEIGEEKMKPKEEEKPRLGFPLPHEKL